MKRVLLFLCPVIASAQPVESKLYWPHLESLRGQALGSKEGWLNWQSSFLTAPVDFDQKGVLLLEESSPESLPRPDVGWQVQLKNGDTLYAQQLELKNDTLLVAGRAWPESVRVPWAAVSRMRRLDARGLIYAGPTGTVGWNGQHTFRLEHAALALRKWDKETSLALTLPSRCSISVSVRSSQRLAFELGFVSSNGALPKLETWRDQIVMMSLNGDDTDFAPLLRLSEKQTELQLTLCWDQSTGLMQAYSSEGKVLGRVAMKQKIDFKASGLKASAAISGLRLKNRGIDLVLDDLVIREWDGATAPAGKASGQRIHLQDGTSLTGTVSVKGGGFGVAGKTVPLDEVSSVVVTEERYPLAEAQQAAAARWGDGTRLAGPLVALTEDTVTMQPEWSKVPVAAYRSGLTRISFGSKPQPRESAELAKMDLIKSPSGTVHGHLKGMAGEGQPQWLLPAARGAVTLRQPTVGGVIEVERARPDAGERASPKSLAFLSSGEVLAAQVHAIREEQVELKSPLTGMLNVPAEKMRALHWQGGVAEPEGFRDAGWTRLSSQDDSVTMEKGETSAEDKLTIQKTGSFGHPSIISQDAFQFHLDTSDYGALQMLLFVQDLKRPTLGSLSVTLFRSGNTLYATRGDTQGGVPSRQTLRNLKHGVVNVRISFVNDVVEVICNEVHLLDLKVPMTERPGAGLVLGAGSLWGNTPRGCKLTGFRVLGKPGQLPVLFTQATARTEALTIPRFRKDSLPKHALIAGTGDILRGRVEVATDKLLRFSSGLESFDVPRERVAAMVWLQKPVAKEPPPAVPTAASHWLVLRDGSRLAVQVTEFGAEEIIGSSAALGLIKVPLQEVSQILWSAPALSPAIKSHTDWQLVHAPEPLLPEAGSGGASAALLGKVAPDFHLPLLDGKEDFYLKQNSGKVVVLEFWATWCGPCVAGMPSIIEVVKGFDPAKVKLLAIDCAEQRGTVQRFLERRGWKLTVALDEVQKVGALYGVEGTPHTVVINRKGKVSYVSVGHSSKSAEKLREAVEKAVGE
jgi:thiol-disulfide isomerase/thioredoxin